MSKERLRYLFFKTYQMSASPDEQAELAALIRSDRYTQDMKQYILEVLKTEKGDYKLNDDQANEILSSILTKPRIISKNDPNEIDHWKSTTYRNSNTSWRVPWVPRLVAASVIIVASLVSYYIFQNYSFKNTDISSEVIEINDLPPGTDKAYLSLSDGTKIDLEDQKAQQLLHRHGFSNDITNGELTYSAHSSFGYSTLTTPLGGQYRVILPDGSKVWLNAGSTVTFPNTFEPGRRSVEMSGEVYFEIATDRDNPFIVKVKGTGTQKETEVRVLGTQFNISSYADEPQLKTTLLEGSVEIKYENITKRLKPGQQALIGQNSQVQEINIKNVDTRAAIAWKEGRFEFNDNIKDIMRQIARWYDVEVQYEDAIVEKSFGGSIPRTNNVSEVLRMLELTGEIRFVIEGRKIIVKSARI